MFNIYKNQQKKLEKSALSIIDYRNGKYQGSINNNSMIRQGLGTLMDHHYLLVIANWSEGKVNKQCIIIYPDNSIFYGFIDKNISNGLGCFLIAGKLQIYSLIVEGNHDLFVIDDNINKSLLFLEVSKEVSQKLYSSKFRKS